MKQSPLEEGKLYHFFNRGNNRENLFRDEENYQYFLNLLWKHLAPIAEIYSYCLLPNHFHLIIRIKSNEELPTEYAEGKKPLWRPFSNLFNAYAKAINKRYGRVGSLFQEHPKRILIEKEDYLRNLILYVNANPDHHGIGRYDTYQHSSYQALISNRQTIIMREAVLERFDDLENFKYCMMTKSRKIEIDKEEDVE